MSGAGGETAARAPGAAAAGTAPDAARVAAPGSLPPPALRFVDVTRSFHDGTQTVHALDRLSLTIAAGECVAIMGPSGSGKSTLLNLAAGIDTPTAGEVWVAGVELSKLDDDALTIQRRDRVGMIYQFYNLLPTMTVRENVALPALLAGRDETQVLARADALLGEVGMSHRAGARPHTLSGGEMQRAAIARALIHEPPLVLADEPTGNLDSRTAHRVLELLARLGRAHGTTVVLVTHSAEAAAAASHLVEMRDGRVVGERLFAAAAPEARPIP
jgi:putative ABC transport system ATP-binding protein